MKLRLVESKADIDNFINKFGEDTYNLFVKSKDRLKNNKLSTDITWHTKNTTPEEMTNMLNNLQQKMGNTDKSKMDFSKEQIPGEYRYLGEQNGYKIYQPLDAESSMALGVNTGWCTAGRYGHSGDPNFQPSEEDALDHWDEYYDLGVDLYYLLDPKTMYGKWAIAVVNGERNNPYATFYEDEIEPLLPIVDSPSEVIYDTNCLIYNSNDMVDFSIARNLPSVFDDIVWFDMADQIRITTKDVEWVDVPKMEELEEIPESVWYRLFAQDELWSKTPNGKFTDDSICVFSFNQTAATAKESCMLSPIFKISDKIETSSGDLLSIRLKEKYGPTEKYLYCIGDNLAICDGVGYSIFRDSGPEWSNFEGSELQKQLNNFASNNNLKVNNRKIAEWTLEESKMIIKDKRKERQERMKNLYEKLTNMPEIDGKRVHGEVDAVVLDAVDSSNERDKKVKDSFKEKNAEVKKFIEEQDKATGVEDDEYRSSRRLFLDEELFKDAKLSSGLKESKGLKKSGKRMLKEQVSDLAYKVAGKLYNEFYGQDTISNDEFNDALFDLIFDEFSDEVDPDNNTFVVNGETFDIGDFETDVRIILSTDGWATDFESGDLTRNEHREIEWAVQFYVDINKTSSNWYNLDNAEKDYILDQIRNGYESGNFEI